MKVLLLAGNTFRSKAYAQALCDVDVSPTVLLYGFKEKPIKKLSVDNSTAASLLHIGVEIPDFTVEVSETFRNNNWPILTCDELDVNSEIVISMIEKSAPDLVIYSGYGGQLLKKNHFDLNIPYLHMHPGDIPNERGSTTIYYSILNGKKATVTAFYMNELIDAGEVILKKQYNLPDQRTDVDNFYDNAIRANCLKDTLKIILKGNNKIEIPSYENSLEYYVIHPLLKHLAILSLKK